MSNRHLSGGETYSDKDACFGIDFQSLANQLDGALVALDELGQPNLNALNLLRDGRQDTFVQPVELIETAPCTDLTKPNENATHSLKVESLVATKDQDEAAELHTKCFDRFGFACDEN
jgi:hypothetical protein